MKREQRRAQAHACSAAMHDAGDLVSRSRKSRGLANTTSTQRCQCWAIFEMELAVPVTVYSVDSRPVPEPFLSRPRLTARFINYTLVEHKLLSMSIGSEK